VKKDKKKNLKKQALKVQKEFEEASTLTQKAQNDLNNLKKERSFLKKELDNSFKTENTQNQVDMDKIQNNVTKMENQIHELTSELQSLKGARDPKLKLNIKQQLSHLNAELQSAETVYENSSVGQESLNSNKNEDITETNSSEADSLT